MWGKQIIIFFFLFFSGELSGQNRRRNNEETDNGRAEISVGSKKQLRVEMNMNTNISSSNLQVLTNTNISSNNLQVASNNLQVASNNLQMVNNKKAEKISPDNHDELTPLTGETCV